MKRFLSIVLASLLLFSCASHPRNRSASPAFFHPDAIKVREAFGLGVDQIPDGQRMNQIGRSIWALCRNVHPVRSSLDLVFDNNHDGRIDKDELRVARGYLYGSSLLSLNDVDPALAQQMAMPPRTALSQDDLRVWDEYLFAKPQIFLVPHALGNNFERKLAGGAQSFDGKVIQSALDLVSRGAAEAFLKTRPLASASAIPASSWVARGPVKSQLQAYANTSGTGVVSEQEGRIADDALKAPHPVKTAFDRAIDFSSFGFIDASDITIARRAAFLPVAKVQAYAKGPFPVVTKVDALLDIDGDGVVTEDELQIDAQALSPDGSSSQIPPKLLAAFNLNGDGRLDANEIERALEFFRPHPVNPSNALDVALDEKKTGFLSQDEIGIGAGHTAKGRTQSLDERIQALRLAAENAPKQTAVFSQKHINITGKKLAVVGLTSTTKNIGQEDLDGTTTFLENAFVNVGSVSIVDRSDIDKVMSELELQLSGAVATNDTNAVKVGKLSGADIIVTGTISLVGKKYYLNVRLITVDTGDILGSSVASADSPDGFLDMCQQAAAKMF